MAGLTRPGAHATADRASSLWLPFAPAARLMGQLRYPWKFALVGAVLLAPLGYAVASYVDTKNAPIAFAVKERAGVVAVQPASL